MSKSLGNVLDPFEVIDALRRRRAALLPAARRQLRPGRLGLDRRLRAALRDRAGQRASATSPAARSRWSLRYRDGAVPAGRARPGARRRLRRASPSASPSCIDRAELTPALEEIWQRVRRLNRYVEEQAPWKLAKDDGARRPSSTACCARWPRACASSPCCCTPCIPRAARAAARRARRARRSTTLAGARSRRALGAASDAGRATLEPLFPKQQQPPRPRDRHPHPPGLLRARRRRAGRRGRARAGVTRILTIGMDGATGRAALAAAEAFPQVYAAIGRHPNEADRLRRRPTSPSCRRSPRTSAAAAIGETGLDYFRDYAPRADQERAFPAQIELARDDRQAAGHPHARGRGRHDRHAARARRRRSSVILHCFSMPDRLDECLAEGWWISFAGNVTYPKSERPRRGRRARARRPPAGRDRRAVPDAAGRAQGAQPAGLRRRTPRASSPSGAASTYDGARGASSSATPPTLLRVVTRATSRRSRACAACAQFGVRPNRDLGQNFLIDSNILGVIERAAELDARRRRAGDRRRARRAVASTSPRASRTCTSSRSTARWSPRCATRSTPHPEHDAAPRRRARRSTSRALDPAPTKVVANLPYGIAASAILRTIEELPTASRAGWRWCRSEVGERFAAAPGTAGLRRAVACSPSSPATCACSARSRARSSTRCRTSTRCSSCCERTRPGAAARAARARPAAPSPTAARRSPRSLALRTGDEADVARARPRGAGGARPARRRARRAADARASSARCGARLAP